MKNLKLYCCDKCGEMVATYGEAAISCCGEVLQPLKPIMALPEETPKISVMDGDYVLEYQHNMTKDDYIAAVAAELYDRVELIRLFPEQEATVRLSQDVGGKCFTMDETGRPVLKLHGCRLYTIYRKNGRCRATLL